MVAFNNPQPSPPFTATFLKNVLIGSRGSLVLSPNDAIARAIEQLPLEPDIGEPLWVSELSGRPGYIYDSLDGFDGREERELRLYLAEDEYNRMILLDLRPEEVRRLHDRHGIFFEIHADFYEPVSYAAVQPKTRYLKRKPKQR